MIYNESIREIEERICYVFNNKDLLSQAFTRSSYRYEHPENADNEILEFIGDSVLSLIVVNALCDKYTVQEKDKGCVSSLDEGEMSVKRSSLVNKRYLAERMSELGLSEFLQVSVGDEEKDIKSSKSVLEDLFESVVGAVYLDSGRDIFQTEKVVNAMLQTEDFLERNTGRGHISYKNDVQEWCQKYGYDLPVYATQRYYDGFASYCQIDELGISRLGDGHNAKEAENNAAKAVLEALERDFEPEISQYVVTFENAISLLQQLSQSEWGVRPQYETVSDEKTEDNGHVFVVRCRLRNYSTEGRGSKVKDAKKAAAYEMMKLLGIAE